MLLNLRVSIYRYRLRKYKIIQVWCAILTPPPLTEDLTKSSVAWLHGLLHVLFSGWWQIFATYNFEVLVEKHQIKYYETPGRAERLR